MHYWLFKTEPDTFSIDDLAACNSPEIWEGIRNYQARNILRDQVAVGDKVFIYHSSCKNVGIAGIGEISRAAYPCPFQFQAGHKYYDAKACEDKPRWFVVDVVFVEKFAEIVPLKLLKQQEALSEMALLKQGRLSIQPVSEAEWNYIQALVKH